MPRDRSVGRAAEFSAAAMEPLVGVDGPNLQTAVYDIVTWATSTALRTRLMRASDFPLGEDLPAFRLLTQLVYRGAARPTDLADAVETSRSNVTRIGRRLEDAGLIARRPDPRDDRAIVLGLTEEGRRVGQRILDAGQELFAPVVEGWADEEFRALERLVLELAQRLGAATARDQAAAPGTT